MFKATFVIALLLVTVPLGEALAVPTKNCPEILDVTAGKAEIDRSRIDPTDKDIDTIQAGLEALEARGPFSDQLTLVEKKSGVCRYQGSVSAAKIYTKRGKDLIYVESELMRSNNDPVTYRIFAQVLELSPTALRIEDKRSFGTMLYFFGLPGPYYDGGFELRPIGGTKTFSVIAGTDNN